MSAVDKIIVAAAVALLLAGCNQHRGNGANGSQTVTQTIAPADGKPAPTGTEPLTQTVDVDHSPGEDDTAADTRGVKKKTPPPAKQKGHR
ncbi:MAG TPA: hypothetical protein VKH35_12760 [Thermoanaerobaculia bacterium]|nr:hypothetical protein [Thermoanaerobaculia bacterium]